MRKALVFEARRDGYGIDQIADHAMTVAELKEILDDYNDDTLIVMSHDRGYTYGSINVYDSYEAQESDDGEWENNGELVNW